MSEQARRLLIVEDDPDLRSQLEQCFEGYAVFIAENQEQAIAELRRHEPPVVLQNLRLHSNSECMDEGLATLAETLRVAPHTKVVVLIDNVDQMIGFCNHTIEASGLPNFKTVSQLLLGNGANFFN